MDAANAARTPNRWLMLVVSLLCQVTGTAFLNGASFLIPYLHTERGLSLVEAGFVASAPLAATMVSLVAWGALVDRFGERRSMVAGLVIVTFGALGASTAGSSHVALAAWFFIGGIGTASANSASGRIVVGWFPPERRGTAMGIRQTALPLGVGLGALLVPNLASAHGIGTTMLVLAGLNAAAVVLAAALLVDPPRPTRAEAADLGHLENPYRRDTRLWRIHVASALLVVPQFTVWTYMLVWLIDAKDWPTVAAGALVAVTQLLGAAGRIGAGWWSDRAGSRLRPMRLVAVAAFATMLLLGILEPSPVAVVLIVVATVVTVADNGLAFTAVAEIGGPYWSGRAMGMQNTGQYLVSTFVPPVVGLLVTHGSYAIAFAAVALCPLLAIPVVPVKGERG